MSELEESELKVLSLKAIIEVLGKPKDHVENSIKGYVEKIKADTRYHITKTNFAEPIEKDSMWSTFVELDFTCKDFNHVTDFCFAYMPSSIELISPEEFKFNSSFITGLFSELQGKLHDVDMKLKLSKKENQFLLTNLRNVLLNLVNIVLASGPKSIEELSSLTGVQSSELESFLDLNIKEGKLKKDADKFSLVIKSGRQEES